MLVTKFDSLARTARRGLLAALTALIAVPAIALAQRGTIVVHVTDKANNAPISQAQISIVGTSFGGLTNNEGRLNLANVPAGPQDVRVVRIGYGEQKRTVTVVAGQSVPLEVQISSVAITLTPVVSTATGQTRRVEIGNSITSIDAAKVAATAPVSNLNDMLNSRAPGVSIMSGSQTGTGARVRIRGVNSISLSNEPIYVIDGIRMTSNPGSAAFGTGGNNPSRVGDLNPEEIENIEIVKGPSAATLYGTDAANGVIVITTKKGLTGAPRWSTYAEGGLIKDRNTYPLNYTIAGHSPGLTAYRECSLPEVSAGSCIQDSLRTYSVFRDPDATPLGVGNRRQFGVQVSGGGEAVRYFLSGETEKETGLLELPAFDRRRFDSTATPIREWTERPNMSDRRSFRANVNAALNSKLDVGVTSNLIRIDQRFSTESNATVGLGSQAFGGPGYKTNGTVSGLANVPLNGYRAWTPGLAWQERTGQNVTRIIAGLNAIYRPFAWNVTRVNVGNDYTSRADDNFLFRGEGAPLTAIYRNGFKRDSRAGIQNFSVDAASSADWRARSWLLTKTTAGLQYVNYSFSQNNASGTELPPGAQTPGGAVTRTATEATTLQKTIGFFVEEQLSLNDRLFLTAAVRSDQNSAFGSDFQSVLYPKFSASWVMSDESFFPQTRFVDNFRLRLAVGSSGVQPGSNDALRYYSAVTTNVRGVDQPSATYTSIGNVDLKPERTSEIETGFDLRTFGGRANIEFTYYNKNTKDALISAIVPPSVGAAATQRANIGSVSNRGYELLINGQLLDRSWLGLDMTLAGSINSNRVNSLGGTPQQVGTATRVAEAYPINGFWANPITGWDDKNKDGILTYNANPALNEVFVGDSAIFRGYNQPRQILTATNGFELFRKRVRVQTLVDYRGGNLYYNNTERIRCASRQNCNGLRNPAASFQEQAMVVAHLNHPTRTLDGFFQPGSFVRLREMSATYTLGSRIASLARARSASLTLTARNLGRKTNYRGIDPETDFQASQDNDAPSEFQTIAPPSYFVLRFNLGF
jgi:TonB-linked SusC/RagA family outer membrane protein